MSAKSGLNLVCDATVSDLAGISDPQLDASCVEFLCFVLGRERCTGGWSCAIVLTTDEHLQRLHAEFMNIDSVTDIMTFPYDRREAGVQGGDIVVSVDQARIQAEEAGWSFSDEIHFLVAHGALHLTGWNDSEDGSREEMLVRQQSLLEEFQRELDSESERNSTSAEKSADRRCNS